jgi:hypothetical protein
VHRLKYHLGTAQQVLDTFTASTARRVTRRRFLRKAAEAGAGVAFTGALLTNWKVADALATGSCSSPCGPSPLCCCGQCNANGDCNYTQFGGCYPRGPYEGFNCLAPGALNNRWTECCTSGSYAGKWKCADCCCQGGTGNACTQSSCGSGWRACICRSKYSNDKNCIGCDFCNL